MTTIPISNSLTKAQRFRNAISGKPVDRPPVWLMRQAGRYLPQYHPIRNKYDFLELCRTPDAAAEVSLQPLDVLDVDAVIVFNDIVTPMDTMGTPVVFTDKGPTLAEPIRSDDDLKRFQSVDFDHEEAVFKTLSILRRKIGTDVALLGFAGCPFTLATYAIEGNPTRNLNYIKEMKNRNPQLLHEILGRLTETVVNYLRIQIEAGVDLVQIFDTWAGSLSWHDYEVFAHQYQKKVIEQIRSLNTPITLYVNGGSPYLELMSDCGADVLSVDWRLPLSTVRQRIGPSITIQGNLDPTDLFNTPEGVVQATREMVRDFDTSTHYIANLGHGILPPTPVESAKAFVNTVMEFRS